MNKHLKITHIILVLGLSLTSCFNDKVTDSDPEYYFDENGFLMSEEKLRSEALYDLKEVYFFEYLQLNILQYSGLQEEFRIIHQEKNRFGFKIYEKKYREKNEAIFYDGKKIVSSLYFDYRFDLSYFENGKKVIIEFNPSWSRPNKIHDPAKRPTKGFSLSHGLGPQYISVGGSHKYVDSEVDIGADSLVFTHSVNGQAFEKYVFK